MAAEKEKMPLPHGIQSIYLPNAAKMKYGIQKSENINDTVEYLFLKKEDLLKDIQTFGKMCEFYEYKKVIEAYPLEQILIYVDREEKYGENTCFCYTEEARNEYMQVIAEKDEALRAQIEAELKAEEDRIAEENRRANVVYEDKPITPRPWVSAVSHETENEIKLLNSGSYPARELISIEVSRPKRYTKQAYKFSDRNADVVVKFAPHKDPNFKAIRENDLGIQVAPVCADSDAQTTWFRSVNKAVQYEAASINTDVLEPDKIEHLLIFLEKATTKIEQALQQNESVDIFHDTFRLGADDENGEGTQAENDLRELKNFADPTYSKSKALSCIDWMPNAQGLVAVSAVRNISFDHRIPIFGQTHTSYILLWDFRLLVKPLVLMKANHEIFTFRFNRTDPHLIVGGLLTGQIVLWDISDSMAQATRKNKGSGGKSGPAEDEDDSVQLPVAPKHVSSVDHSHKKCVADLFWLSPRTQINYRGQLVGDEHLDDHSYQFVTVAGDGLIMIWDIRYEQIFNDEKRHIGRAKHVPTEKSGSKEGGGVKPVWGPIFKAHLKRLEGVGELSLCKVCETAKDVSGQSSSASSRAFQGDHRSQFTIATEEGDVMFTDLSARRADTTSKTKGEDEEDADEEEFSCVKWMAVDHPRPTVCLMESPFFPQILLSVSDWGFHIWKSGEDKPLFVSPISNTYLTAGAWSLTRPAVLFVACADGQILAWDFTDTSFKASIELKATHSKITSMEFLSSNLSNRHQLLAVGDEMGTLHIFEVPRNLTRPVHKEEAIMLKFLEREIEREIKPLVDESTSDGNGDIHSEQSNRFANSSNNGTISRVGTAVGGDRTGGDDSAIDGAAEEAAKLERDRLNKEEEEFLKMESSFVTELGLQPAADAAAK